MERSGKPGSPRIAAYQAPGEPADHNWIKTAIPIPAYSEENPKENPILKYDENSRIYPIDKQAAIATS